MSEASSRLAHHFDDLKQQTEASTLGMWTFLLTEILFFGGLFAGYAEYRDLFPQAFEPAVTTWTSFSGRSIRPC